MFSLFETIITKVQTNTKNKQSAEFSVDFFNGEVQKFDKYGYSKNGCFDVNIYSYYFKKRCNQNKKATDVNYKDIL